MYTEVISLHGLYVLLLYCTVPRLLLPTRGFLLFPFSSSIVVFLPEMLVYNINSRKK